MHFRPGTVRTVQRNRLSGQTGQEGILQKKYVRHLLPRISPGKGHLPEARQTRYGMLFQIHHQKYSLRHSGSVPARLLQSECPDKS